VELASGVHWFLKERCNSSVAWAATGGNQLDLACLAPGALAARAAGRPLYRGRSVPYHYYQNAVTPRRVHRVRYPTTRARASRPLRGRAVAPCRTAQRAALRRLASGACAGWPGCLGTACRTPYPHLALQLLACGLVVLARFSYTAASHTSLCMRGRPAWRACGCAGAGATGGRGGGAQLQHDVVELGALGGRDRLDGAARHQPAHGFHRRTHSP